jgi:hypothetical protein
VVLISRLTLADLFSINLIHEANGTSEIALLLQGEGQQNRLRLGNISHQNPMMVARNLSPCLSCCSISCTTGQRCSSSFMFLCKGCSRSLTIGFSTSC